ncbi:protein kinase domain-containing protein [Brevibacterium album]|uniref:protein kinase domain-containing protein n=1 Tax=Brevibacterium album TaxID=417948 RepID=UPI00040EFD05|nr:protein kinase [Brevibacterium album]
MSARLAHYRLEQPIGVGSYATVHRAVDERLDDVVAIKILAENHSLNLEIRQRFIAEGRSLRRVGGAHVVSVYDIGESERHQPYLVLEHADRGTLRDRVEWLRGQGWRASPDDLLAFARPLAAAVDAVHRQRLVHRDLSPGNLLLSTRAPGQLGEEAAAGSAVIGDDERLLLADLGMCKDLAVNSGLTVSGGTDGFRPPEQEGPGVVDIRADIWAMSALLAWLADGGAPPALAKVLKRGTATRPQRRQPDAEAWLREVEQALAPPAPEAVSGFADAHGAGGGASGQGGTGQGGHLPAAAEGDGRGGEAGAQGPLTPRQQRARLWGRRIRRTAAVTALLASLVGGVLLGRWAFGDAESPPAQADGASVSITGPEEVPVGEPAVFTAEVEGADSWAWTLPSRRYVADQSEVTVTATTPGSAELVLRAEAPDGSDLEVRRAFRVVE